jgi:hypothetical protein
MNDEITNDRQDIKDALESVHRYRDHAMWDKISDYFVDKPYVNDLELTKEAPGIKSIKELVAGWKHELRSYFYATRHKIQSMTVKMLGSKQASASSEVKGQYFINDRGVRYVLNVDGTYEYNLVKKAGRWKIGELKFKLKNQTLTQIGL